MNNSVPHSDLLLDALYLLYKWIVQLGQCFDYSTGWTTEKFGYIHNKGRRLFSAPQRPDLLWGPPTNSYSGQWELCIGG